MRFSGVRTRLFLVSILLLAAFGATGALYLAATLRPTLEAQVEAELWRHARAIAAALDPADLAGRGVASERAGRFGAATATRVSLIRADGAVIGDSGLSEAGLTGVANHAERPEVRAALSGRPASARRRSETVGDNLLYVAVVGPDRVVVRVARPLAQVDAAMDQIGSLLWVASGLGLLVAAFMSFLASELLTRPLRRLLESARALAAGRAALPIAIDSPDELDGLAGEINRLGTSLQDLVANLAQERDRLQAVLAGTDEVVLALDAEGLVALCNPAARALLGADPEGRSLADVADPALVEALTPRLGERPQSLEIEVAERAFLIRVTPQARVDGWIIVMLDITRLRRLEKMRQDFVANVSHELRTPISVIQANAETLLDGAIDDPVAGRRFLEALVRNAARLSNLIADLLDIARIEAGKLPSDLRPTPLAEVVAHAAETLEGLAAERGVDLVIDVPPGLLVVADAGALEQVLINLLENGIKYTQRGGEVRVGARAGEVVRVEVRDTGPGIPEAHRARVFERFYRVDAGRSSEMGGTGLGLAIVKHLVLSMNGRVGVAANAPRGSVFWVELPS